MLLRLKIILAVVVLAILGCTQQAEVNDSIQQGSECTKDSDCAPAGCSGQVCTTAAKAPGIITTCEYLEEYSCLKETSCGCMQGKCAWARTEEYQQCLSKFS